ncbi:MAG: DJ-1/PfpI family protein [Myxococcota bacterium]|jgi:4-methyl-5(b-hydroxyethyl)-thiazole monophosphate biosynthesis|nr:DJ-1/PfpI family protein [Myxococcota bacterium]
MSKTALVLIATGFEEIEALTVVDILRRSGALVVLAGVGQAPIVGRSEVSVNPDATLDEALKQAPFDLIVLPGGLPNAHLLRDDARVQAAVQGHAQQGRLVAAICAAPLALQSAGVLEGQRATSHPGVRADMRAEGYVDDRVVVSGRIVTSRAPGTAMEFAFELVRQLYGESMVNEVNQGVLARL